MNKAELIADIKSRVITTIGDPVLKADVSGVKTYVQTVLSPEGVNKANERNIAYIIVDEGGPGERAYYRDTSHLDRDDREKAATYMGNLVSNGTIDGYQLEQVVTDLGSANFFVAKVWIDNGSGKLVERRLHVTHDGQSVVRKEIL